jgi:hypothetical protein
MSNDQSLTKQEKRSLQNNGEYAAIQEVKDTIFMMVNALEALQKKVLMLTPHLIEVNGMNYLQDWHPFSFDGLSNDALVAKQDHIELIAMGRLMRYNMENGTNYVPTDIQWTRMVTNPGGSGEDRYKPLVMAIEMYLNPPAVRKSSGGGSGGGSVNPSPGQNPPPPAL